ncbi:MAG: GMC family oxidoreductase [Gemmatimonadaceae bacterium]
MRRAEPYDVAIVGAGSAGCALAGRLAAKTDLRIALVEAGPDYGPRSGGGWPADVVDAHHSPDSHDWGLEQSRARVVGGCSAHNECAIVRALPGDYDRWRLPGWSDADLASVAYDVASALPHYVCHDDDLTTWQRAFLDAAVDAGIPRLANADAAPGTPGVAPFVQNIANGVRWNAAFAFLDPVRSRVDVVGNFLADRLILDGDRARALVGRGRRGEAEIRAKRFVLCTGVYGSPTILLRSGVGPRDDLAALRIPTHADLPGVGANLHDHPGVGLEYEPTTRAHRAVKREDADGRFYEVQLVLRTAPDLHVVPYQARDASDWSFGIITFYLDPRSRGRVRLTSRAPDATPAIDLGFLSDSDDHDVGALVEGMRVIHDLTKRSPLAKVIKRGPRRFSSDARVAQYVRENVSDYGHSVGTCRMGPSPSAGDVVDVRGRVHGLANVFVADASIIPRIPRANTNLTCSVIGARVADVLPSG